MIREKQYLGDEVYAAVNDYGQLVLTAEDGERVRQIIYLEPATLRALYVYTGVTAEAQELREQLNRLRQEAFVLQDQISRAMGGAL